MSNKFQIPINGDEDAPIVCLLDFPTYADIQRRLPLDIAELNLLDEAVKEAGFNIDDVAFCSLGCEAMSGRSAFSAQTCYSYGTDLRSFLSAYKRDLLIAWGPRGAAAVGALSDMKTLSRFKMRTLKNDIGCPLVLTEHSFKYLSQPDRNQDTIRDLRYAKRVIDNDFPSLEFKVWRIESPSDIKLLRDRIINNGNGLAAYDHETTSLDYEHPNFAVVSTAFYWGETENGLPVVAYWCWLDAMKPVYEESVCRAMHDAWREFYNSVAAGDFSLMGHNTKFDDPASYVYFGANRFCSSDDTRVMVWCENSDLDNKLKTNVERYCGVPRYDDEVDLIVGEIAARRNPGSALGEDDLRVLDWFNIAPTEKHHKKTGQTTFHWPKGVDKKLGAYALLPADVLMHYNCLDALLTWDLGHKIGNDLESKSLLNSYLFRMRIDHETRVPEERGMLVNRDLVEKWVNDCIRIENATRDAMTRYVQSKFPDSNLFHSGAKRKPSDPVDGIFNPNSHRQVCAALYGEPVQLPTYDTDAIESKVLGVNESVRKRIEWWSNRQGVIRYKLKSACRDLHNSVYQIVTRRIAGETPTAEDFTADYADLREAGRDFSPEYFESKLKTLFRDRYGFDPPLKYVTAYPFGEVVPLDFTDSGNPSTSKATLELLYSLEVHSPEFLRLFLTYRRASKIRGTFLTAFLNTKNGAVRPRYNACGARGGRISSSNPNGQNINKNIRGACIARPGYVILGWDLSQVEVRILAALSQDQNLISAVQSKDLHSATTAAILNKPVSEVTDDERKIGKITVFAVLYGVSASGLAMLLKTSVADAELIINSFYEAYPQIRRFMDDMEKQARTDLSVRTLIGTRRWIRDIYSISPGNVSHAARVATNAPVQGTAGELCFWYIFEILDAVRSQGREIHFWGQVHDFAGFEVPGVVLGPNDPTPPDDADYNWCKFTGEIKKGQEVYTFGGPDVRSVEQVFLKPPPWGNLNTVPFKADIYVKPYWDATPDLYKAIDPNYDKADSRIIPYALIDPDSADADDLKEVPESDD